MSSFDDYAPGKTVGPVAPGANLKGSMNNQMRTAQDVAALWKQLTGRDATPQEAGQWGQNNIDDAYWDKIYAAIKATPEAQAFSQGTAPAQGTGTTTTTPDDWTSKDYSDWNTVKAYAQSRGVTMSDETAQYWANKYNSPEFAGDRQYFFQRLSTDPAFGGGGGGGYGDLLAPFTEQFSYDDFKAPTMDDLKSSPGFQASLDRASNTLQRSAAAKGSLLSGSTLQSLSDQTADLTSQGYSDLFKQDAQTYQTNRGNAYDAYKERRANFYQNQDSPYAKLMGLASLQQQDTQGQRQINLGYAGLANQAMSGGANQYNSLLTGGANAQASGIMGQSNAYQGLYGAASQIPSWLALLMRGRGGGYGIGSSGGYTGP